MVGWHLRLNGHEFEQAPGDGEGQESLESCSTWGLKVGQDWATEQQQEYTAKILSINYIKTRTMYINTSILLLDLVFHIFILWEDLFERK